MSDNIQVEKKSHRGRPRIIIPEPVIRQIVQYHKMGVSYRKIVENLKKFHDVDLKLNKVQDTIRNYGDSFNFTNDEL